MCAFALYRSHDRCDPCMFCSFHCRRMSPFFVGSFDMIDLLLLRPTNVRPSSRLMSNYQAKEVDDIYNYCKMILLALRS